MILKAISNCLLPLFVLTTFSSIVYAGGQMNEKRVQYDNLNDVPNTVWQKLSKKKIYFGHQSVGFNIIEGIKDIKREYPSIYLSIEEKRPESAIRNGGFIHSRIGKNQFPDLKIDDFADLVQSMDADIAFLKLCYVDIHNNTDVEKVFGHYRRSMKKLQEQHPETAIVHLTVPLRTTQTTWKTKLKKLMGKEDIWEYQDNIKRNQYNEMIRSEFGGSHSIFDIARFEATKPNGESETFELKGQVYESLCPVYTYDGGHLNEQGRKIIAEQLLLLLVNHL